MSEHWWEELQQQEPELAELIESIVEIWETIPLLVWILLGIAIIKLVSDYMSPRDYEQTSVPSDRRSSDRVENGPSRERYSIHDDLDEEREYHIASESDPIEAPNQVDRSILGTMRRLARKALGGSRDGD